MTSYQRGTARPAGSTGNDVPRSVSPSSSPVEIAITVSRCIDQPGRTEVHAAPDQVQHAVEEMWARHQHHARADRDKAQRRAQFIPDRQRSNYASDQCRAKWLQEDICAVTRQRATE